MGFLGDGGAPLQPHIDAQIANHLSYMENGIAGHDFFVGNGLTGADIQLLFVLEAAALRLGRSARAPLPAVKPGPPPPGGLPRARRRRPARGGRACRPW